MRFHYVKNILVKLNFFSKAKLLHSTNKFFLVKKQFFIFSKFIFPSSFRCLFTKIGTPSASVHVTRSMAKVKEPEAATAASTSFYQGIKAPFPSYCSRPPKKKAKIEIELINKRSDLVDLERETGSALEGFGSTHTAEN